MTTRRRNASWPYAAVAAFVLAASTALGQDDRTKLPTPQITDIAYVGEGVFGPRYKIDFVAVDPDDYECVVRLWIVIDRDGQYSITANTLGEQEVEPGDDVLGSIPLHRSEIAEMSYTATLTRGEEWIRQGNAAYAYAYYDSFSCYSDVGTVVQLPPPVVAPERCPVTPRAPCQIRRGSDAGSSQSTRFARQQEACEECSRSCSSLLTGAAAAAAGVGVTAISTAVAASLISPAIGAGGFVVGAGLVLRQVWTNREHTSRCWPSLIEPLEAGDDVSFDIVSSDPSALEVVQQDGVILLIRRAQIDGVVLHVTADRNGVPLGVLSYDFGDLNGLGNRTFTDQPIRPGITPIRAIHFHELRERIAALRDRENLPEVEWRDRMLTVGGTLVRAVHLAELREALDEVYDVVGWPRPRYEDVALAAGVTPIRAVHLLELRAAIAALE